MIIVWYGGGLGNQMYQYALQVVLEHIYPDQEIKMDLFHYNLLNEHNGFELDRLFGINIVKASTKEIRDVYNGLIPKPIFKWFPHRINDSIAHRWQYYYKYIKDKLNPVKARRMISDGFGNTINKKVFNIDGGNWYYKGMWQNLGYFDKYRDILIERFSFNLELGYIDKEIENELINARAIAVHVRGGDFLTTKFNLCSIEYYREAIDKIKTRLPLIVFTDDEKYASQLLHDYPIKKIVSHPVDKSIIDLYMLSISKYIILSNSTFSFWGAYLNRMQDVCVVYPKYLTYDHGKYRKYIGRNSWLLIDNSIPGK